MPLLSTQVKQKTRSLFMAMLPCAETQCDVYSCSARDATLHIAHCIQLLLLLLLLQAGVSDAATGIVMWWYD